MHLTMAVHLLKRLLLAYALAITVSTCCSRESCSTAGGTGMCFAAGAVAAQPSTEAEMDAFISKIYDAEVKPRFEKMMENASLMMPAVEQHYMDFTGSGVYLNSQVQQVSELLLSGVYGNPHSKSASSQLSTEYVDRMRQRILEFFSADPEEYELVFTRSATGALYLLAESFPWNESGNFAYLVSNHNSVLGMRELAKAKGAPRVGAFTEQDIQAWLASEPTDERWNTTVFGGANETGFGLVAYPAKDNFDGVLYPLEWIEKIQNQSTPEHEWMVLLDAAAFVPTYKLDLSKVHPDFVVVSFYKVFGLPTGVGAWIMKKDSAAKLKRTYWGGSSVFTATSTLQWFVRYQDAAKFEDGTLPFLEIMQLEAGFDAMDRLGGIEGVQEYTEAKAVSLSTRLKALKHSNGAPMLKLNGKHYDSSVPSRQSAIANFQILKPNGTLFSYRTAARALTAAGFNIRDGCMCNPGSCYRDAGVTDEEVRDLAIERDGDYSNWEWIDVVRNGTTVRLPLGSIRVSLGWMSREADIDALVKFLNAKYKDSYEDPIVLWHGEAGALFRGC